MLRLGVLDADNRHRAGSGDGGRSRNDLHYCRAAGELREQAEANCPGRGSSSRRTGRREAGERQRNPLSEGQGDGQRSTRERLQAQAETAASAEQQGLDRRDRHAKRGADLRVPQPIQVAEHDGLALLFGQPGDRELQFPHERLAVELRLRTLHVAEVCLDERQWLPHPCVGPCGALVARDRGQPGGGFPHVAAPEQGLVGGDEGRLGGIVRVVRVAQQRPAESVDHAGVLLEERGRLHAGNPRLRVAGTTDWVNGHGRGS